ncbi:hypothetical protein [Streptomyces sp. NPDC048106]|uniref:hypothetical protein n=1 Tax=Streptomyces sp. NPDC048106 TaxID=3155750 RepID=UPI003451E4B8
MAAVRRAISETRPTLEATEPITYAPPWKYSTVPPEGAAVPACPSTAATPPSSVVRVRTSSGSG